MTTTGSGFHVAYDIPEADRRLLSDDRGESFELCATGYSTRAAAEAQAQRSDSIECHGSGVKHYVMSTQELTDARKAN